MLAISHSWLFNPKLFKTRQIGREAKLLYQRSFTSCFVSWYTPPNRNTAKRHFTLEQFVSLVHALSANFLALRLCSIFLLVKGTIISITSSEKSTINASKSVFALSSQPTGTGIFITIFTDVRRRNFLINDIFVSYVVLHLLCLLLERPSTCSRSLSFSISWSISTLSCNKSKHFLSKYI